MLNHKFQRWLFKRSWQEYLPNIAEVMAFTWRFNTVSSSATGLRADSASSGRFNNVVFSVSQLARSFLNPSLICSVAAKAVLSSSLALEASDCWDLIFSSRSAILESLLFILACKDQMMMIFFSKSQAYNQLYTWHLGVNAECFFPTAYLKSQGSIQVWILALGV